MYQPDKKKLILVGGGGHCKACIEIIESTQEYDILGILDLPNQVGSKVLGYEVIGTDADYSKYVDEKCCFLVTVGHIKSANLRERIFNALEKVHAEIISVIASTAVVSKYSKIGKGTVVMHHCLINANVQIGDNCVINSKSLIEHDTFIGSHCHISTGVILNGGCNLGTGIFIGSNTCVLNGTNIRSQTIIGAGSLVINDINESGTYIGSPAQKIK